MHINIDINIDNLTEDELLALNRRVIARLKLIQQHSTLNSMIKFNAGQLRGHGVPARSDLQSEGLPSRGDVNLDRARSTLELEKQLTFMALTA